MWGLAAVLLAGALSALIGWAWWRWVIPLNRYVAHRRDTPWPRAFDSQNDRLTTGEWVLRWFGVVGWALLPAFIVVGLLVGVASRIASLIF